MTGTSGWLGSTIRMALEANGARVLVVRHEEGYPEQIRSYRVDVLINCGHPMTPESGFGTEGLNTKAIQANFNGAIQTSLKLFKFALPRLALGNRPSIINIASMYAIIAPNPKLYEDTEYMNPIGYGIAKAGMLAMTRYIASFYGKLGIRCNAIVPGAFPKPGVDPGFQQRLADRTVLGRVGKPEDLVGAVLFLASDASAYMTGQALVVDGGWSIT